jgi:hypothetical protein
MEAFDFVLRLNRMPDDEQIEALFDAGCGDGTFSGGPSGAVAEFHREAESWAHALGSAVADIEAVPGLLVTGAGQDDQVAMLDIARRAGCTREAVRLWAAGKRGPGGFPAPTWTSPGGERFWSWPEVATWLRDVRGIEADASPDEIRWADDILADRLRQMEAEQALAAADPAFTREFSRLLSVA